MKIKFSFCLTLLTVLSSLPPANAQKLTGAFAASFGIAVDSKDNVYVTGRNNKVIKIDPSGKASLFAGGARMGKDGQGTGAGFMETGGIAIDAMDNIYLADGSCIRKITPDAVVTTIAGSRTAGIQDGHRSIAQFWRAEYLAIDKQGTIYVTDYAKAGGSTGEFCIRKITSDGTVSTLKEGGNNFIVRNPRGLACDDDGNLYISCNPSHCIRKITPSGQIIVVAGQCDKTILNSVYKEGPVNTAVLTTPGGIAIADDGSIYFSDPRLHRIIKVANGKVATVAGGGKMNFSSNPAGAAEPGYADGKALLARFEAPDGIAFDRNGNLFIIDRSNTSNSYIRKFSPDGTVITFCKHEWNPKTSQYEEMD